MDRALQTRVEEWLRGDPDPATRAELRQLLDEQNWSELEERFADELDFGTAGLRGAVAAGPARMNRAVVMRAVRALAENLIERGRDLPVIVGYDARPSSRTLAEAAAGVLLAAGLRVRWFDQAVATPLVAYAARVESALAALVITASHNPRGDNGLKIYGSDAIQLGPPHDADIARRRAEVGPANAIPCRALPADVETADFSVVGPELYERYLSELEALLPPRLDAPKLKIVYTPIHGVGGAALLPALARRGFAPPAVVREQAEPNGEFPTTPFPNPEVSGTLDLALALAKRQGADVLLANDPDADRLAAAVNHAGALRVLTGNEVGALLADFLLSLAPSEADSLLVTSIVSSPLIARVAEAYGARVERTLTGFKWIWSAAYELERSTGARLVLGCEEALGYSVGSLVRDKDGIAAAVWFAELAERARREGQSLIDRLHALYRKHGAWASTQRSLTRPGSSGLVQIGECVERLAASAPDRLGELRVLTLRDYRVGASERPRWLGASDLIEIELEADARVLVRPSGTEPKLKIYCDVCCPVSTNETPSNAELRAQSLAAQLAESALQWLTP